MRSNCLQWARILYPGSSRRLPNLSRKPAPLHKIRASRVWNSRPPSKQDGHNGMRGRHGSTVSLATLATARCFGRGSEVSRGLKAATRCRADHHLSGFRAVSPRKANLLHRTLDGSRKQISKRDGIATNCTILPRSKLQYRRRINLNSTPD